MWGYLRDRRGKGPGRNADTVILASDAQVIADATDIGDGGSIIVYGTETAEIDGTLMARGGPHGGDGGFIETSAAGRLEIAGIRVDASAPDGEPGTWLIDPTDITIDFTKANNIAAALEGGSSVEVKTDGTGTPQYGTVTNPNGAGNITVVANIQPNLAGSGEVTLTLVADNDVIINSGVTIGPASATGGDRMGVTIIAENDIKFLQSPSKIPGTIDVSAGAGGAVNLTAANDIDLGRINAGTGNISITATGGKISDNTAGEGADNENLVGGAVNLTAGTGIGGATAAADIDTATANISADTTDGGIDIANTLTANTTVTSLTSANVTGSANGDIRFAQSGGGTVTFGTVTTDAGAITLTNDTAGITLSGPVTAGGTNTVQITAMDASRGNINGEGLVTAATVDLDAGTGIGNTTALELAATTISADTTDGSIDIDNTLAADVTVTSLTSTNPAGNASGAIQFDQSGGGAVDFTTVTTNDGAIALTNTNAGLSVTGSVEAGGTGKNLTLTTINSGDIVLTGTTMATDDTVLITSAGAIDGSGQLTAATANLNAATGIGDTTVLELAATKISADTTDGGINIDNTLDSEVTVSSLTSTNATGSASGDIRFAQSGGGAVTFGPVTTDAGAVTLTNDAAGLGVTGPITAGGAGNAVDLDAAGLLHIAAAVSGSRVELTGDTGIGHTANGEVTATSGGITAGATTGDISMADGTVYRTTGGDVTLTAANNVNLGRVDAGSNAISVTATGGKISDNTMAEGTDNENLVGREIVLRAGSGIGAVGEATDIDTKMADRIDARITGPTGDVAIAETGAVRLGDTVLVTPGTGGSIQVSGSTMTIDQAVTTTGSGTIRLATTIGDLQVNRAVTAGGGLNLDAAGLLNVAAVASGSSVELTGGTGIAHTAAGSVTSTSGAITATATTGDIGMANGTVYRARGAISLTAQRDVALGRVEAGANPIRVTATTGSISDITGAESENLVGGAITLQAATGIGEPGGVADIDTAVTSIDARTTTGPEISPHYFHLRQQVVVCSYCRSGHA